MNNQKAIPKISVIVPIYNVEEYLEKCLSSIANQTFRNFEVILCNDGSTDTSPEIAMKFAARYLNFRYVSQLNEGVSSARNKGLALASGEYIAFIDSDDFIEPEYLQRLYETAVEFDSDIVICGFKKHWLESDIIIKKYIRKKSGIFSSENILHCLIKDMTVQYYVWNKLYRRKLFIQNDITFPNMRFEDIGTLPKLFYYSKKITVIPDYLYIYSKRKGSIISELSDRNLNDFVKSICMLRLFLEEKQCFRKYKTDFNFLKAKASVAVYPWTFLLHFRQGNFHGFKSNVNNLFLRLKKYSEDTLPDRIDISLPTINITQGDIRRNKYEF